MVFLNWKEQDNQISFSIYSVNRVVILAYTVTELYNELELNFVQATAIEYWYKYKNATEHILAG